MNSERIKEIEEKKLNKVLARILRNKSDAEKEELKIAINTIIDRKTENV